MKSGSPGRAPTDGLSGRLTADVLACLSRRDGKSAESLARRLIKVEHGNDRAYFLLTNALCLQDRLVEALIEVDRAISLRANEPDYVIGKAQILGRLGWSSQAIEWYQRALSQRPSGELATEYSSALLTEGFVSEGIRVLEGIQPGADVPSVQLLLGRAYTEAGRFGDAEAAWNRLLKQGIDSRTILLNRITSEVTAGRLQVAEGLVLEALEQYSDLPQLYARWATLRRVSPADAGVVERMEELWGNPKLAAEMRSELGYALGKAYDDLGDYGRAIQRYDEANRAAYMTSPVTRHFDAVAWKTYIDQLIQFFSKERVAQLADRGSHDAFPLFIVGMIRSGTTMTEHILSGHPEVAAGGETTFWADYRNEIFDPRFGRFDAGTARRLGSSFSNGLRLKNAATRFVTEKNPMNLMLCGILHCTYPKARFVHIDRHPLDNALSIWMTPLTTGLPFVYDRNNIVAGFRDCRRLARHFADVLPPEVFQTFAYEDITSDPQTTITKMLQFLDLPPDESCLHPERNTRSVRTPSAWQVRQPLHTQSQAKWKHYERWLGPFAELADL